jgi:hypothetical protein
MTLVEHLCGTRVEDWALMTLIATHWPPNTLYIYIYIYNFGPNNEPKKMLKFLIICPKIF